ncbi:hypothetical protein AB5I41_19025 [Sphingomonas sp. MMS24-JH45]
MFRDFSDWITDQVNASLSEVHRELLSRAHLKAVKLASLQAVACSFENPVVSVAEVDWAIHWVQEQTAKLLSQFESGKWASSAAMKLCSKTKFGAHSKNVSKVTTTRC